MRHYSPFKFKQFEVQHDQCAMKVNTDGILLGAWCALPEGGEIVDIGTGTGLIALMLAQRSQQQHARISAIDIDSDAANQATLNAAQSPWSDVINVEQSDVQSWSEQVNNQNRFSLVVSNPPYFDNMLKSTDNKRRIARHTDQLSYQDLLSCAYQLTHDRGQLAIIVPYDVSEKIKQLAHTFNWHLWRQTDVVTATNKPPSRSLLHWTKQENQPVEFNDLTIRELGGEYSDAFCQLCRDFYPFLD